MIIDILPIRVRNGARANNYLVQRDGVTIYRTNDANLARIAAQRLANPDDKVSSRVTNRYIA